eukprot:1155523-Pelagomonas_calceolata.AAC.5
MGSEGQGSGQKKSQKKEANIDPLRQQTKGKSKQPYKHEVHATLQHLPITGWHFLEGWIDTCNTIPCSSFISRMTPVSTSALNDSSIANIIPPHSG